MNKIYCALSAVGLVLLSGCAAARLETDETAISKQRRMTPVPANAGMEFAAETRSNRTPRQKNIGANHFQVPAGHQMAFTAHLRLSVDNVRAAVEQARETGMRLGGYVKRMDDSSVALAIPSGKAETALMELKKSGVLLSQRIEGEDVTRQVTDIAVRLDNLEKSRKRLLALLEKAGKVEEMVKVENAITRVTTELERLQAQQKNLRSRIDYVSIYIKFTAAVSKSLPHNTSPVGWVNELGSNLLALNQRIINNDNRLIIDLKLPAGFVKNGSDGAVSGDHCVIELYSYVNAVTATHWYGCDYAGIEFYAPMIETALAERFKVPVTLVRGKIDGRDAAVYTVKPEIGGISYTYRVAVAVVKSKVKVIAARARSSVFERSLPEKAWKEMLESVSF